LAASPPLFVAQSTVPANRAGLMPQKRPLLRSLLRTYSLASQLTVLALDWIAARVVDDKRQHIIDVCIVAFLLACAYG
jgi:hypothetical protein